MVRKKIDDLIKKGILDAHKEGLTQKKIAEKFGVSTTSVSRVIKSHAPTEPQQGKKEAGKKSERSKRIEAIEKRIQQLEKKLNLLLANN